MIDINVFVRGMAWHDVGKPFYLGGDLHSLLGHLWLCALDLPGEALVTLAHDRESRVNHLKYYGSLPGSPAEVPAILALSNVLDVVAAATYSFMGKGPPEPKGETHHSWQNPYSRLPQASLLFKGLFDVDDDTLNNSSERRRRLEEYLGSWPQSKTGEALSKPARRIVSQAFRMAENVGRWRPVRSVPQTERTLAFKALLNSTTQYPERTYPPVNDTTLKAHAHLSGVLAFVLYRNLETCDPDFLRWRIALKGDVIELNGKSLEDFDDHSRAMKHLDGFLVRISLEGHRDLFDNAVRLDDLHGTRALARMTLDALIAAMAKKLGVPDLAGLLVITRTPFDVTYYLPACLGAAGVRQAVRSAYDLALDRVTGALIQKLEQDFRKAGPPLDWSSRHDDLKRQLHSLAYGLRVAHVAVEDPKDFDDFNARFANALVEAYRKSMAGSPFPRGELGLVQADLALPGGGERSVHDICQVCETHPIDQEFNRRAETEEYLRKVVHEFRGQAEPICVSCIARRILAHGAVQSQPLTDMLKFDGKDTVIAEKRPDGPSLPPNLARTATFTSDDDHLDMGAAFVHQRGERLDVFPTVHYAADEMGNVALLTLQPTQALFEAYDYGQIIDGLKEEEPDLKLGIAYKAEGLRRAFEATVVHYYRQVEEEKPDLVKHVRTAQPHLARVLSRIDQVNGFYAALQERMERHPDHPLRVLPIDAAYPTARLMVPADQIDRALDVLNQAMAEDLFSASLGKAELAFLSYLVKPLLLGSVVVFKAKYPLYLALEAERVLVQRLVEAPANQYWGQPLPPGEKAAAGGGWFGLRLGLCDLRGTLAERGPWQGQILWADMGDVLRLEGEVDRVTVLHKAILEQDPEMRPLAEALTLIRANVTGLSPGAARRLGEETLFRPVLFLKQLTREGAR